MAYKWKPSASQRRAFAERMKDPVEQQAYNDRKEERREKNRAGSRLDYSSAGGEYIPTEYQWQFCMFKWPDNTTTQQDDARNQVISGYTCKEKVHHDYIHIVNEMIRASNS